MLSLAALLSEGAPLPFSDDEESYEPVTIIYQTTEDDADDTVVPRFNAAGGDGERLVFIKEDVKRLTFGDDRIREAVEQCDAKLLILDPMSSYIGDDGFCSVCIMAQHRGQLLLKGTGKQRPHSKGHSSVFHCRYLPASASSACHTG